MIISNHKWAKVFKISLSDFCGETDPFINQSLFFNQYFPYHGFITRF